MEPIQASGPEVARMIEGFGDGDLGRGHANGAPPVQSGDQTCPTCNNGGETEVGGGTPTPFVFAVGKVVARFPSISVEREFAQAASRAETAGLTDRQRLQAVLSERTNRYLARRMCWVLTIEGLETYILLPHEPADIDLLLEAIRPEPSPLDVDVVIGVRGPIAPPHVCNGLMLPTVIFDQIYSFDRDTLIKAIPRPEKTTAKEFAPAAEELFDRILQLADNSGATDAHRAVNYLAVRYPAVYEHTAAAFNRNASLAARG